MRPRNALQRRCPCLRTKYNGRPQRFHAPGIPILLISSVFDSIEKASELICQLVNTHVTDLSNFHIP